MILLTGATGLVGGHLLWHLLQENEKVVAIKRKASNTKILEHIFGFYGDDSKKLLDKVEWRIADVLDKTSLINALADIDTVYHCAAVVSLGMGSQQLIDTNVQGTQNIVDAAIEKSVKAFCMVSSIAACGKSKNKELVNENTLREENDQIAAYAQSKFLSEKVVWEAINKGLNACILNPGVILGFSGTQSGSSQLFAQVRKGLPFYTSGGSGYVDVQDVVKAMILLLKAEKFGERFILVAENNSNKEILTWMARGFGKKPPFILIPRNILLTVGSILQTIGKITNKAPLLDKNMARSATNREFYSSEKFVKTFGYKFNSIENCIYSVCKHWDNVF